MSGYGLLDLYGELDLGVILICQTLDAQPRGNHGHVVPNFETLCGRVDSSVLVFHINSSTS